MKSTVYSIVKPCNLETARRFRGTQPLHLQDQLNIQQKFVLLFDPEDGDDMFPRNVRPSSNSTPYNPETVLLKYLFIYLFNGAILISV
jgi:hypothetical protein